MLDFLSSEITHRETFQFDMILNYPLCTMITDHFFFPISLLKSTAIGRMAFTTTPVVTVTKTTSSVKMSTREKTCSRPLKLTVHKTR